MACRDENFSNQENVGRLRSTLGPFKGLGAAKEFHGVLTVLQTQTLWWSTSRSVLWSVNLHVCMYLFLAFKEGPLEHFLAITWQQIL